MTIYNNDIIDELREKAAALPLTPGVYIMKDASDKIIYIGKSKALKNRVSSYFTDLDGHNVKTAKMVSQVRSFEYILTDTNMEALALENRLIKLHMPKFNIRLKDGKSYPYIKITFDREYPQIIFTRRRSVTSADTSRYGKAEYFGPYSGASTALSLLKTSQKTFGLASCNRSFPRDIGKERPCIYKQLGHCSAPCDGSISVESYREQFKKAAAFLNGSFAFVKKVLSEQMENAAEELNFEAAAVFRDRIRSLDACRSKQKIIGSPDDDKDVIAFDRDTGVMSLSIFFVREGCLVDRDNRLFGADVMTENEDIVGFLCDYYRNREYIPREILIDNSLEDELRHELEDFLNLCDSDDDAVWESSETEERTTEAKAYSNNDGILSAETAGHGNIAPLSDKKSRARIRVKIPERGESKKLCKLVRENALEAAMQFEAGRKKQDEIAIRLAELLQLEVVPSLIESYDISNYGSDNITAGKVSVKDGKFLKSAYRTYKIKELTGQDDYASMAEAVRRRLSHTEDKYPDLILLDGGRGQVSTVRRVLSELNIDIPVYGMVKDEYHKTRAIAGEHEWEEVSIAKEQAVFGFVYRLQEEVHRYTIGRMRNSKRKSVKKSILTEISGIGENKAQALTARFHTLSAISEADIEELMSVKGITKANALSIKEFFDKSNKNDL